MGTPRFRRLEATRNHAESPPPLRDLTTPSQMHASPVPCMVIDLTRVQAGLKPPEWGSGPGPASSPYRAVRPCSYFHVPYHHRKAPFADMRLVPCGMCGRKWVAETVLATVEAPEVHEQLEVDRNFPAAKLCCALCVVLCFYTRPRATFLKTLTRSLLQISCPRCARVFFYFFLILFFLCLLFVYLYIFCFVCCAARRIAAADPRFRRRGAIDAFGSSVSACIVCPARTRDNRDR